MVVGITEVICKARPEGASAEDEDRLYCLLHHFRIPMFESFREERLRAGR